VEYSVFRVLKSTILLLMISMQLSLCSGGQGTQEAAAETQAWRKHAILAEIYLRQGSAEKAIKEAERALDLGQGQAAFVRPILARALADQGDRDRAIAILRVHVKEYPSDAAAGILLASLETPSMPGTLSTGIAAEDRTAPGTSSASPASPAGSRWLPSDEDDGLPPVESRGSCDLEEILEKAGNRIKEFVGNVDRFTATESLDFEKFNKAGNASRPETHKFDYVVSIAEVRPGMLSVEEYRHSRRSEDDFSSAVASRGLPAMVLIFHPYESGNFDMTCEGMVQIKGTRSWQLHFRQRSDKPNRIRAYRVKGMPYAVSVKGRAWIAADSYQMLKMETSLVAPMPQIGLVADHTIIEYGPVHFQKEGTDMWLPESADVYSDFRAQRHHEHHSFSNYLLFSVGEMQRISAPKALSDSSSQRP
jgi:hypothetical protein